MGDESTEEQGYGDSGASDQSSYDYSQSQAPSDGSDGDQSAGGAGHQSGQPQQLDDSLFNQLGQLYSQGQYGDAINKVKPLVDSQQGDPNWGRAAYGLIMCYDSNNQLDQAFNYMQILVNQLGSHPNRDQYMAQLQCYQDRQHWTGDFLLY